MMGLACRDRGLSWGNGRLEAPGSNGRSVLNWNQSQTVCLPPHNGFIGKGIRFTVAVDDQRGNIHAGQILPEVFMPSWNACQAGRRQRAGGDVPTGEDDFLTGAALPASITPIHGTEALVGQRELRR